MTSPVSPHRARPPRCAETPAGVTAKATTQTPNGPTCREEFDARTSVKCNEYASTESGPFSSSSHGGRSLTHTIPQAFERMNAPQIRSDNYGALPPLWLMVLAAFVCLFTLLVADTLYSAFFFWMTGVSL